jgi:hypothetical protein
MRRQIVYIAGAYRSRTLLGRILNIWKARQASIKLSKLGYCVFCPHTNWGLLDRHNNVQFWLDCGLKILPKCQIIYMLKGWENSEGAKVEFDVARDYGLKVWFEGKDKPEKLEKPEEAPYFVDKSRDFIQTIIITNNTETITSPGEVKDEQ